MIKKSLFPPFPTPSSYPEPFQVHLTHVCLQLLRHPLTLGKPESASLICHRPWAALLGGRGGGSVQEFSPTSLDTTGVGGCESSSIPGLLFHPASWLKDYSHFPALMHQLQAQRQMESLGKWVYEPISNLHKKSLLLYFIPAFHEKCSITPSVMILWGICDHISEWKSANKFSKSERFVEEKGHDLFSTICRYWKG